ncbi:MAG: Glucose-6-phosphate isomerase, partial [Frankiales bacterium]|nr:Glucose-6-phosphate isomerase [Frankiales bacterium]
MIVDVTVQGEALEASHAEALAALQADSVARRLADHDATLWGPGAESEAEIRLGWLDVVAVSWRFVPGLLRLRDELRAEGLDDVILCGMGGSSLAPEVICKCAGVPLTVLDSTHPDQVRAVVERDLSRTVVVVSSKSGTTLETDAQRRALFTAMSRVGIDAKSRIVVVTDPGSALEQLAKDEGYRAVFLADPHVGGRYSALTAFGLVPSALAGADVELLLDQTTALGASLGEDSNAALKLGAALGADHRDKIVLDATDSPLLGFGDWAEQLIAESTGKQGRGLLPVVVAPGAPEVATPAEDVHVVHVGPPAPEIGTCVTGNLGAQFLAWEYAVAVSGRLLGINPFDQPDVESAKVAARGLLDEQPTPEQPRFVDGAIAVFGSAELLEGVTTVTDALAALLEAVPERGYLAVMAYLDRPRDASLAEVRNALATRLGRPV